MRRRSQPKASRSNIPKWSNTLIEGIEFALKNVCTCPGTRLVPEAYLPLASSVPELERDLELVRAMEADLDLTKVPAAGLDLAQASEAGLDLAQALQAGLELARALGADLDLAQA